MNIIRERIAAAIGRWRYGGKPYGKAYAETLRASIDDVWHKSYRLPPEHREIPLETVNELVEEITCALMECRLTVRDLEPEIDHMSDIMRWIHCELIRGGFSGIDPGSSRGLALGSLLLTRQVFHDMLRTNPEQAMEFAERKMLEWMYE